MTLISDDKGSQAKVTRIFNLRSNRPEILEMVLNNLKVSISPKATAIKTNGAKTDIN